MLWRDIPRELEMTLLAMLAKQPHARPALPEIVRVLGDTLAQLRASKRHPLASPAAAPPSPPLGSPRIALLATKPHRMAGAALGFALTVLGLIQLFSA
jgi:hypothetical protein